MSSWYLHWLLTKTVKKQADIFFSFCWYNVISGDLRSIRFNLFPFREIFNLVWHDSCSIVYWVITGRCERRYHYSYQKSGLIHQIVDSTYTYGSAWLLAFSHTAEFFASEEAILLTSLYLWLFKCVVVFFELYIVVTQNSTSVKLFSPCKFCQSSQ